LVAHSLFEAPGNTEQLAAFDAVWGAPGSPYASMQGMLNAISYVRVHDIPYLGTCGGFQYALIELTRSLLGVADANSAENDPEGANIVITPIACAAPAQGPRLSGANEVQLTPGSLLQRLCDSAQLSERFFCSFETNPDFVARWEAAGVRVAARGADGAMRALELPERRFFLATLFQPQLSSSFDKDHPIVTGLLRAAGTSR
jgi:CTP synthase (UTP-ammonia lyase)